MRFSVVLPRRPDIFRHGRDGWTCLAPGVALLVLHTIFAGPPALAESRATAYSIHMLAKVASRCVIRDMRRFVVLTRDEPYGAAHLMSGRAHFRVECNVPYVLETASYQTRAWPRAKLIPLSAELDAAAIPEAPDSLDTAAVDTKLTAAHCSLSDAGGRDENCPTHVNFDVAPVLPRAIAQLRLAQSHDESDSGLPDERVSSADVVTVEIGSRL